VTRLKTGSPEYFSPALFNPVKHISQILHPFGYGLVIMDENGKEIIVR